RLLETAPGAPHQAATTDEAAQGADLAGGHLLIGVEVGPAQGAPDQRTGLGLHQKRPPAAASTRLSTQPTPKAKGKMNPLMARAVFGPRSFHITENWAMQGRKRVRVTAATTSCAGASAPACSRSKSPAVP